jgi:hypothetical protein
MSAMAAVDDPREVGAGPGKGGTRDPAPVPARRELGQITLGLAVRGWKQLQQIRSKRNIEEINVSVRLAQMGGAAAE